MSRLAPALALALVAVVALSSRADANPRGPGSDPDAVYAIPVGASPVDGPANAKVTIVETSDYACPYCQKVMPTMDALRKKYGNDVRIVYKSFIVHKGVVEAAAIAACAANHQGKWRAMSDLLWSDAYTPHKFDNATIDAIAAKAKLDMTRYKADVAGRCIEEVDDDQKLFANLGLGAIPTMFVNGRVVQGAQPIESFTKVVDAELAKATAAIKGGVKQERYYDDQIVANGIHDVPAEDPNAGTHSGTSTPSAHPHDFDPDKVYKVRVGDSPVEGPANAKVTLVTTSDYACPYCEKVVATFDDLRKRYGNDLRIVHKTRIVHTAKPRDVTYAEIASCAANRQGKWRVMSDLLWSDAFHANAFDNATIDGIAAKAKLDIAKYKADVAGVCAKQIADENTAMQSLGVNAIPTMFINGHPLIGAQPIDKFIPVIDAALAKATEAVKRGVKPESYYDQEIVANGIDSVTP